MRSGARRPSRSAWLFWGSVAVVWLLAVVAFFALRDGSTTIEWRVPGTSEVLRLENSEVLLLALALPSLLLAVGLSLSGLSLTQRLLSFALRAAFLGCLILSLAQPMSETASARLCYVALLDVSKSVSDIDLELARGRVAEVQRSLVAGDQLELLTFAEEPQSRRMSAADPAELPQLPSVEELRLGHLGEGTNLELAFDLALSYAGSDCKNRYLLFSDGVETRGHALSGIDRLVDKHIALIAVPLERAQARDVAVIRVESEDVVRVGEPFLLRVELSALQSTSGQLRLYQDGILNGLDAVRAIDVPRGTSSHTFKSVVRVGGEVSYRAEFIPAAQDAFVANNSYVTSLDVPGPPRVLLVDRRPGQVTQLLDALVAQQFDVDVRNPDAFPQSFSELNQFDFVILSDISRDQLSRGGEALVESYVRSGGGLLFAGGEASYGPGGWQGSTLGKILPVRMDAQKEREIPGVAMSLVIDRSGSMTGLPLSMAKEACVATLSVLDNNDLIEVIAFDSRPTSYVPLQPARYRLRIEEAVSRIQPGGGTEIFASLDRAYQSLSAVEARRKHIVLLTDGNAASDGIYELVSTAFAEGITITAVGLGAGINQSLLTMIADTGGGRFIAAEDPTRLPRIFTREAELISTKPTLEDWFPISVVKDAEFFAGINLQAFPMLRGYTSTQLGPPPAEMIFASDRGEPILARQRVGLGWSIAWTSDLKSRWATDVLRFRQFGQWIAQLVRAHQKTDHTKIRPMDVRLDGDEVVARVEAFNEHDQFENDLHSTLEVRPHVASAQSKDDRPTLTTDFASLAPGLYEARLKLPSPGAYALRATHRRGDAAGKLALAGMSFGSVSWPYPEEYRELTPRTDALKRLASMTNGATWEGAQLPRVTSSHAVVVRQKRQYIFIFVAMILFFADLLVRRVRLFDRGFLARQPV